MSTPYSIVIHDNGSTYPPLLRYLEELKAQGTTVYREEMHDGDIYAALNRSIDRWYQEDDSPYFVVTDPDIELLGQDDLLDCYIHILETKGFEAVGPELLIDDIPDYYPLKEFVQQDHGWEFWSQNPAPTIEFRGREVSYTDRLPNGDYTIIASTFAVHRKGFRVQHDKRSARCYPPYAARHLDWYINPGALTDDFRYYLRHAPGFGRYSLTELLRVYPKLV
jgi:hypothetical protein